MADSFNLTANINLQGPINAKPVIDKLRKQLSSVKASVNIDIPRGLEGRLDGVSKRLGEIQSRLKGIASVSGTAGRALSGLDSSARKTSNSVQRNARALSNTNTLLAKTARGAAEASTEMEKFGSVSGLAIRRFAGFTVATGVIFGFIGALTQGVAESISFERQLIKVSQVTKTTTTNLAPLTKEITRLSTSLGVSSSELANISLILSQAGLSARETRIALNALAKSSLAPTFTSITATAEGSIAAIRQFNLDIKDLERSLGSINAVAGKFAVESDDIIAAIRRTGGVFAAASQGIGTAETQLQQFIALFTSVRATTRESAESIATGLRTIFTRIQRRSTLENLKQLGIELVDAEGKFIGVFRAIEQLNRGLKGLDPRDVRFSAITEELGGFRQIGKTIPLIQRFNTAQEAYIVAQKGVNSLSEDAEKAQEALAVRFEKTRESFLALLRGFSQSSTFKSVASSVLNIADSMISLADSITPVLPILATIGAIRAGRGLGQFVTGFGRGARGQVGSDGEVKATEQINSRNKNTAALEKNTRSINNRAISRGAGGPIKRFATGGMVGGSGSRDKRLILAQSGEFIVSRKGVEKAGVGNLMGLNGGGEARFNAGGPVSFGATKVAQKATASQIKQFYLANQDKIKRPRGFENLDALTDDPKIKKQFLTRITHTTNDPSGTVKALAATFFKGLGIDTAPAIGGSGNKAAIPANFIPTLQRNEGLPLVAQLIAKAGKSGSRVSAPVSKAGLKGLQAVGVLSTDDRNFKLPILTAGLNREASSSAAKSIKQGIFSSITRTAQALVPGLGRSNAKANFLKNVGNGVDINALAGNIFESAVAVGLGLNQTARQDTLDFRGVGTIDKLQKLFGPLPVDGFADAKLTDTADSRKKIRKSTIKEIITNTGLGAQVKRFVDSKRPRQLRQSGGRGFGIPALTTPGEAVFSPSAVRRIGESGLERLNRTGDPTGLNIRPSDFALVPGSGNSDTFPTNLAEGSFVIRKGSTTSAGLTSNRSIRRFARGGSVSKFQNGGRANSTRDAVRSIPGAQDILREVAQRLLAGADVGRKEIEAGLTAVARGLISAGKEASLVSVSSAEAVARTAIDSRRAGAGRERQVVIGRAGRRGLEDSTVASIAQSARNPGDARAALDRSRGPIIAGRAEVGRVEEALRLLGNSARSTARGVAEYELAISGGEDATRAFARAQKVAAQEQEKALTRQKSINQERRKREKAESFSGQLRSRIGGFLRPSDTELASAGSDSERRQIIRDRRSSRNQGLLNAAFLLSLQAPGLIGNKTEGRAALSGGIVGGTAGASAGSQLGAGLGPRGGLIGGVAGAVVGAGISAINAAQQARTTAAQESLTASTENLNKAFQDFEKTTSDTNARRLQSALKAAEQSVIEFSRVQAQSLNVFGSVTSFFTRAIGIVSGGNSLTTSGGQQAQLTRQLAAQRIGATGVAGADVVGDFRKIATAAEDTRKTFARNLFEQSREQRKVAEQIIVSELKRGQTIQQINERFGDQLNLVALSNLKIARQVSDAAINAEFLQSGTGQEAATAKLKELAQEEIRRIQLLEREKQAITDSTQFATRRIELLSLRFKELGQAVQFALTAGQEFEIGIRDIASGFSTIQNINVRQISGNTAFEGVAGTIARNRRGASLLGNNAAISLLSNIETTLKVLERVGPELLQGAARDASIRNNAGEGISPETFAIDLFRRLNEFQQTPVSFQDAFQSAFRQVFSTRQGGGPEALTQLLERDPDRILDAIRTSIGTAAVNARKQIDSAFETIANNFVRAANVYVKAQLAAADSQQKINNLIRSRQALINEAQGRQPLRVEGVTRQVRDNLREFTGRFGGNATSNVAGIENNLRNLLAERADLNRRRQGSTDIAEQKALTNQLAANQLRLDQNTKALDLVANETTRLSAIQSELAAIERSKAAGRNLAERLASARVDPRVAVQLNREIQNAFAVLGAGRLGVGQGGAQQLKDAINLLRQLATAIGGDQGKVINDAINAQIGKIAGAGGAAVPQLLQDALKPQGETKREKDLIAEIGTITNEQIAALKAQSDLAAKQAQDVSTAIQNVTNAQITELRNFTQGINASLRQVLADTLRKQAERQAAIDATREIKAQEAKVTGNIVNVNRNRDVPLRGNQAEQSGFATGPTTPLNISNNSGPRAETGEEIRRRLNRSRSRFATGGMVGGIFNGRQDTQLARLTPGEFVVKRRVAQKYAKQLENLNNGQSFSRAAFDSRLRGVSLNNAASLSLVSGFAEGGFVGGGLNGGVRSVQSDMNGNVKVSMSSDFVNSIRRLGLAIDGLGEFARIASDLARASVELSNINIPTSITMEVAPIQVSVIHNGVEVFANIEDSLKALIEDTVVEHMNKHVNVITGETRENFVGELPRRRRRS